MKRFLVSLGIFIFLSPLLALAGGDEIEMKDGTVIQGDIIARNAAQIYLSTKERKVLKIDSSEIKQIRFGPAVRTSSAVQKQEAEKEAAKS